MPAPIRFGCFFTTLADVLATLAASGRSGATPIFFDRDHARMTPSEAGSALRGDTVYFYSMTVTVVPMRKRGVPINPHMREAGAFVGHLRMLNYNDPVLHRMVRRVDLLEPNPHGQCKPMLPPLLDASLVTLGDEALVLTGFERLKNGDGRPVDFAQSWWIQLRS